MSDSAGGEKIGGTAGAIGGGVVGSYFGPVGTVVGSALGGYGGKLLGGAIGGMFGSQGPSPEELQRRAYAQAIMQQQQQAYAQQQQLAGNLMQTAEGKGPSVAGLQLGQGLEQIQRGQLEQAAGATGQGGVLARYAAMNNAATAGAAENQQAALARAAEVAHAQQALGGVLNNESSTAANIYGTQISGQNAAQANAIAAKKNDEDFGTKLLGSGLSGLSQAGAFNSTAT